MNATLDRPKVNGWLSGKAFTVSQETFDAFSRLKKKFGCKLCGHTFAVGDIGRWIYCNGTPHQTTGNFFVCSKCDEPNEVLMPKAKASLQEAIRLAKQWDIYGPDWQSDFTKFH